MDLRPPPSSAAAAPPPSASSAADVGRLSAVRATELLDAVDGTLYSGDSSLLQREAMRVMVGGMTAEHILERLTEGVQGRGVVQARNGEHQCDHDEQQGDQAGAAQAAPAASHEFDETNPSSALLTPSRSGARL